MTSLTSKVVTVWSAREAGLEALAQALIGVGLYLKRDYLFTSGDIEFRKEGTILPVAPQLEPIDVQTFLADWINLGYPAFQNRYKQGTMARLFGVTPLEVKYPEFLDVIQGPVDILLAQLEARALSQDSKRYWIFGRRRVRSTPEQS